MAPPGCGGKDWPQDVAFGCLLKCGIPGVDRGEEAWASVSRVSVSLGVSTGSGESPLQVNAHPVWALLQLTAVGKSGHVTELGLPLPFSIKAR